MGQHTVLRNYLSSETARQYDACKAMSDMKGRCTDRNEVRAQINKKVGDVKQRLDVARSLYRSGRPGDKQRAKYVLKDAAAKVREFGVTVGNAVDFKRAFPKTFREIKRLLNRLGSARLMLPFLAITDPQNTDRNVTFKPGAAMDRTMDRVDCSYIRPQDLGAARFVLLQQELSHWVRSETRCYEPIVPPQKVALLPSEPMPQKDEAPKSEPPPEKAPPPPPPPPPTQAPPKIATPKYKKAYPPPPPGGWKKAPDIATVCVDQFPEDAQYLWDVAKRPLTFKAVQHSLWMKCGYNAIHDKHTKQAPIRFSWSGDRLHFFFGGKTTTYRLWETEKDGRKVLTGIPDDLSKLMVPPHMGGPRGDWGPIEIRMLNKNRLLIYFRIPSDDGKDYTYAYVIADRGQEV